MRARPDPNGVQPPVSSLRRLVSRAGLTSCILAIALLGCDVEDTDSVVTRDTASARDTDPVDGESRFDTTSRSDTTEVTDAANESDMGPLCNAAPALELGRCVDSNGEPCSGAGDGEFASLPESGELTMVVGPQGATMFVIAVRAREIDPGDPTVGYSEDNPRVRVIVRDELDEEIAFYDGHVGFAEDPDADSSGTYVVPDLFVVVDVVATAMEGQSLHASATLTDSEGRERCGELDFIAAMP